MTLIVENGSGVAGANTYVEPAFVTSFLTNQDRQTEGSWSTGTTASQEAACIKATQYIENRFRLRFKGVKEYSNISQARSTLTLTAQPSDGETVTIGTTVYTFNTILGGAYSVLIDTSKISQTIANLVDAINANETTIGTIFGTGTVKHPDVSATSFYGLAALIIADNIGEDGNFIASTETLSNGSWNFTTLTGGKDHSYPQPLSFPRSSLYDSDGVRVYAIPDLLKSAVAEYAVRAHNTSTTLLPDPEVDDTGRNVIRKKDKVGPIEEEREYSSGGVTQLFRPYPTADRYLQEFLLAGGRSIRG